MALLESLGARHGHWLVVAAIGACAIAAACGSSSEGSPPKDDGGAASSSGGSSGEPGGGEEPDAGSTSSSGALPPDAGLAANATEPNLRVAFIGDTASGADFKGVLGLVKSEGAQLLLVQGDLTYDGEKPSNWFPAIDNTINKTAAGSTATVTIPYLVSQGNHDTSWSETAAGMKTRMAAWAITPENGDPATRNYSVVYKGLKIVFVAERETDPTRADYAKARLQDDSHIWRICSWHKNRRATNVGPKNDEMPWAAYDTCRAFGAIVAQGHSHTYSRSKTMTAGAALTVDPACKDPFSLCVGPGKHFFFDSSLGGHDMRDLEAEKDLPHFASAFTGSFGALFIDFHVDGDPKKARGYFKTTAGKIIDPPASSGKTSFEITSTN